MLPIACASAAGVASPAMASTAPLRRKSARVAFHIHQIRNAHASEIIAEGILRVRRAGAITENVCVVVKLDAERVR